ncbi:hypothetical protein WICMUC_002665 [Wickerhamomyces mucosus]|uniref:MHD domain-containing protein n=1 Tax=Wickerhamomyces mucosus TaxID=1378264 RepID=A0A9P8TEN2_9ASCO|nr:hypothetical protein WICMUC_002665 [Wickerhamomyces mucosus]
MINALFIFNERGDVLISKFLKEGVKRNISDVFKIQVVLNVENKSPVLTLGSTTFIHIRFNHLYLMVVTRSNTDLSNILEYLFNFKSLLFQYFIEVDEDIVKDYFTTIYDLIDETLQYGYPQSINFNQLKEIIPQPNELLSSKSIFRKPNTQQVQSSKIFDQTNNDSIPWRSKGIKYKKNEIYLDVIENLNILISSNGTLLRSFINGLILVDVKLSGIPQCEMMIHDISIVQDLKFHKCVELNKFDRDNIVQFIPPDSEFQLLTYKCQQISKLPFNVTIDFEELSNEIKFDIKIKSLYGRNSIANDFVLNIPIVHNLIDYKVLKSGGSFEFVKDIKTFKWNFSQFQGLTENSLNLTIKTIKSTQLILQKPSIYLDFEILSNSSGLSLNYLKVKENYKVIKWIRYITKPQSYEIRY